MARQVRREPILAGERGSAPDVGAVQIGVRLRHARLTKGLSLLQLSQQVGCTESFLSKIENEKARPSLAMLHRIAAALDVGIARLFTEHADDDGPVAVMRVGQRPMIVTDGLRRGPGITLERLVSGARAGLLQVNIHHVAPHGSSDGVIQHDGEEFGYVLKGDFELVVDDTAYLLREGDAFFFESTRPHAYKNPHDQPALILWVNTPPSF